MAKIEETLAQLSELEAERQRRAKESPSDRESRETREETVQKIIDNLEELGGKMFDDDEIVRLGQQMILPENMSDDQAIEYITRNKRANEQEIVSDRTFMYRPWDGAFCTWQVMKRTFGAVTHRANIAFGLFGPMEEPPEMHTINVDVGKTEQIPWGSFVIPHLPEVVFSTGAERHPEYGALFKLTARGPRKHRFAVEGVFQQVEQELKTNSIYRGKAFDGQGTPEFIDVFSVDPKKVVYSEEVTTRLRVNIWSRLRYTKELEQMGTPIKRAILIHGPFGTGKTLALMLTGQEAVEKGWTFILARPGRDDLAQVLQTARLYQPCVVAYEDLDQIAAPVEEEERPLIMRLLDDFDGIQAKGTKIVCVLTTNYPERIHKGMVRPGRLDAVIKLSDLDEKGVESLVRVRIPDEYLSPEIDWSQVFAKAQGYKPAFVTEFADRAMLYTLDREGKLEGQKITTDDLCYAATDMREQYDMMEEASDLVDSEPLAVALDRRLRGVIETTIAPSLLAENQ
jgi:transitional endoplasmic reticulum ATPase